MDDSCIKLLTVGGGSGQFALLSGLRDLTGADVTAVVSMADSGGSTGRLRDELGILPPGDVLKCVLALSAHRDIARTIFLKKFTLNQQLSGHNAGNMLLTMLSQYTGSFPAGVQALAEILDVRGHILPVTVDRVTLVAELTDGSRIYGEKAIDIPRGNQREKIKDVFLVPHHSDSVSVYPPVIDAIRAADYIIIGPGDLFTSIIPSLIVPGVREALLKTRARILYIISIMTKFGETHQFRARDFVMKLEERIQRKMDAIIYNSTVPDAELIAQYRNQKAQFVEIKESDEWWQDRKIYASDLLDSSGGILRHDAQKLACVIRKIVSGEEKNQ